MKLLVDMNLAPSWVERLARHGFAGVHWSTIGSATAPDVEILAWANEHRFVVITNDLAFSAILAASAGATPSVVQIRTQDLLSNMLLTAGCRCTLKRAASGRSGRFGSSTAGKMRPGSSPRILARSDHSR